MYFPLLRYRWMQNVFLPFLCFLISFSLQAQTPFSEADASQIVIQSRHLLGEYSPTAAKFSPDGKRLAITTENPVSLKIFDCATHTEVFSINGPYKAPQWSPDSRQIALTKDSQSVIINIDRRHVKTLKGELVSAQFWFWVNKDQLMYVGTAAKDQDTLIVNASDLQGEKCPVDSALALFDTLVDPHLYHPNCYITRASKDRWMVANRDFSYWQALFTNPLTPESKLEASCDIRYVLCLIPSQKQANRFESWLYKLGVEEKVERQFTTALFDSLDIIDQTIFRQHMGPGYLIGGVIKGDSVDKAVFRLDAFTATCLHLTVLETYQPVTAGDSITQFHFYRRNQVGKFEIMEESSTPMSLKIREYELVPGEVMAPMSYSYDPFALDSTGAPFFMTEARLDSLSGELIPAPNVPVEDIVEAKALNKEVILQELIPFFNSHDIEGNVVLRVLVDAKGVYKAHKVIEEVDPLFVKEVEKYLQKLRFLPARASDPDRAIASWLDVSFGFSILEND